MHLIYKLEFDKDALEDLKYWKRKDPKKLSKIFELITEIQNNPYLGKGKPEPLKYALQGCWSRRIDSEHRLVYQVIKNLIRVIACRYHY